MARYPFCCGLGVFEGHPYVVNCHVVVKRKVGDARNVGLLVGKRIRFLGFFFASGFLLKAAFWEFAIVDLLLN